MKFQCWIDDGCAPTEIDDALDEEDAAQLACEKWERDGRWSGDPIPSPIEVHVHDENGVLYDVDVEPQYDVSFWAHSSRRIEAP